MAADRPAAFIGSDSNESVEGAGAAVDGARSAQATRPESNDAIRVRDLWHLPTCGIFHGSVACSCGAVVEAVKQAAAAPRSDEEKLADAIGRLHEIGRFQDGNDREPIVVYLSHGDTGLRYIIGQENEEAIVLTVRELRWLVGVMFGDTDPIPAWRFWWANLKWRLRRV